MNNLEQKLIDTVNSLADDIVDFTAKLVAEPSTLGEEKSACEVMAGELDRLGFTVDRIPMNSVALKNHPGYAPVEWPSGDRENIVATLAAVGQGGHSALFNGHLDVVNPGKREFWSRDPFDPAEFDGWLYGRGSGDMKSGVAAMTYAAHAVGKAGFGLCAPFSLTAVLEEECCGNGALACLAEGYDAEAVLIPEPFGPTTLTDQLGVLWFKVRLAGRATHVLDAKGGINAIEKCYTLIEALRGLERELNAEDVPVPYASKPHPINLNIGIIEGGDWPSTVPSDAVFHARLAFFPGVAFTTIADRIQGAIDRAAKNDPWLRENPPAVDFYGFRSQGHSVERTLPAMVALEECHKDITGTIPESYIATCTTDLRAYVHYGTGQATCYGPVAENIHGPDERVNIESIIHVARVYALFLSRWCGLVER